jgi:hypothetical protein
MLVNGVVFMGIENDKLQINEEEIRHFVQF